MRILFWIALFVLVYWALRHKSAKRQASRRGTDSTRDGMRPSGTAEPMLQCRQCGVYFPASEATRNALGDAFCCEEHRRAHGAG